MKGKRIGRIVKGRVNVASSLAFSLFYVFRRVSGRPTNDPATRVCRSEDLVRLSRYMMMFYAEQPVDWLMTGFRLSMGQRQVMLRKPTLFQHVGVTSSFDTSRNNDLKDRCVLSVTVHVAYSDSAVFGISYDAQCCSVRTRMTGLCRAVE